MNRTSLLLLDDDGLSVWQMRNGKLQRIALFTDTADDHEAFRRFVREAAQQEFRLLINRHEEHYLNEILPELPRRESRQLAESRLRRHFPETIWRCASAIRAGQAVTLMALSDATVSRWQQSLASAGGILVGAYSLPTLLPGVLGRIGRRHARLVVLSKHRNGCRITLLAHGQPVDSLWNRSDDEIVSDYRRLLERQPPNDTGNTARCVIGPKGWPAADPGGPLLRHVPWPGDDCAQLLQALPERHWPARQFAPEALVNKARQRRYGRLLNRWALLIALIGLVGSLERLLYRYELQQDTASVSRQLQQLTQRLDEDTRAIRSSGLSSQQLLLFASDHRQLRQQRHRFVTSLQQLSQALEHSPEIRLDLLEWQIPVQQALPAGRPKIEINASASSQSRGAAERLIARFRQACGMPSELVSRPQPASPGEFRFTLRLTPERDT